MPKPAVVIDEAVISLRRKKSVNTKQLSRNLRKYHVAPVVVAQACQGKTVEVLVPGWTSDANVRTQFGRQFHCLADWEVVT